MKKRIVFILLCLLSLQLFCKDKIYLYFDTIDDICKGDYSSIEALLENETKLSPVTFTRPDLTTITTVSFEDSKNSYTVTYRKNNNTDKNEVLLSYSFDDNFTNLLKYNTAKNTYEYFCNKFGLPSATADLGFLKYNETQNEHSITAEWKKNEYKIVFSFIFMRLTDTYSMIIGPNITIEDKTLNKDIEPLLLLNMHTTSTYFVDYKETVNDDFDFNVLIDFNKNRFYNPTTLLPYGDVTENSDFMIKLNQKGSNYTYNYEINRYTGSFIEFSYPNGVDKLFAKSYGTATLLSDKPKF